MSSKAEIYFNDNVVDDLDDILQIASMAKTKIYSDFKINFDSLEGVMATYMKTFEAIMDFLKSTRDKQESVQIIIADRLEIGYTSTFDVEENNDLEKYGNFSPYMKHLENDRLTEINEEETLSVVRCNQWFNQNITSDLTTIDKISTAAVSKFRNDLDLKVAESCIVMPIFCTIHDCIVKYMMLKLSEQDPEEVFEEHINVCGCYEIYARRMDDGINISYKPQVFEKGNLKQDGIITAKNED